MKQKRLSKLLAVLLALGLMASACGGTDDIVDSATEAAGEVAEAVDTAVDEATDTDDGGSDEPEVVNDDVAEAGTVAEGDVDTEVVESDTAGKQGGELIVGIEAEINGMRPWEDTCGSPCMNVLPAVFDKLTEQTATGTYEPWLLESLSSNDDFTIWTGMLREGVVFHDGTPLTAQSIADMFPIQQEGAQSAGQIGAANLEAVDATGDLEVTWTLSQSNSAFPVFLSRAPLGMVFEAGAAADLDAFNKAPIGTGPFVMVSRDLDNETVMTRNTDYWGVDKDGTQLPYVDDLIFRPIPDEGTRLDALLSGTTNVAHTLRQGTIRDARAAAEDNPIFLYEFQGNNVGGGMFNVLVPPFDDVRVRRGLVHLNPQDQVIEALGGTGISLPGTQWFSPDSPWYSEKAAAAFPQFDFAAGEALLAEYVNDPNRSDGKAVGDRISAELSCPPDPTLIAAMQVLEQVWSATEYVDTELTNYDQATHISYALGSDNGFVGSHTTHCWRVSDDNDPSLNLNPALAPPTAEVAAANGLDGVVSPLNWSNYFDLELFGNLQAATQTADFDERYALYEKVMIKLNEDVPIWFSGHTATALIADDNVKGLNSWELPNGTLGAGLPNAEGRWAMAWIEN